MRGTTTDWWQRCKARATAVSLVGCIMGLERNRSEQESRKRAEAEIRKAFGWELTGLRQSLPGLRTWLLDYLQLDEHKRKKKYDALLPTLTKKHAPGIAWVLACAKADWYAKLLVKLLGNDEEEDERGNMRLETSSQNSQFQASIRPEYEMKETRIMWIERKDGLAGPARIGRVTFSKSGKSIHYGGKTFHTLAGRGFKANYADAETGEEYWISGCHKDGRDALYNTNVEVDEDVREEYWSEIRKEPDKVKVARFRAVGKCK